MLQEVSYNGQDILMRRVEFYRHSLTESDIAAAADVLRSVFLTTGPRAGRIRARVCRAPRRAQRGVAVELHQRAVPVAHGARRRTWRRGHHDADDLRRDGERHPAHRARRRCSSTSSPRPATSTWRAVERGDDQPHARRHPGAPVRADGRHAGAGGSLPPPRHHHRSRTRRTPPRRSATAFRPGQLGQAACFSFYATKNLTCGEGGAAATQDAAMAESLRRLRSHGMSKEAASRYTERYQHWDMLELGYKANLSDIQAALLLGQLPRLAGAAGPSRGDRERLRGGLFRDARRRFPACARRCAGALGTCSRSGYRESCRDDWRSATCRIAASAWR